MRGITARRHVALGSFVAGVVASPWLCATALAGKIEPQGAAIHVLDPVGAEAFKLIGLSTLSVFNGAIVVNSSDPCAFATTQSPALNAANVFVAGGTCLSDTTVVNGTIHTNSTPAPDPLAALPAPSIEGMPAHGDVFNPGIVTLTPGFYPYGMRLTSNFNYVTLMPGVYVLGTPGGAINRGLTIQAGTFTAYGCLLYLAAGAVDITANASVMISPPDSGLYQHVSIFQSRTNTVDAMIWAGSNSWISGTLYLPINFSQVAGDGFAAGIQWIVNRLWVAMPVDMTFIHDGAIPICWHDVAPINGDGTVNVIDLLEVINRWGPCASCTADITRDGTVNVADLLEVINAWGDCLQP